VNRDRRLEESDHIVTNEADRASDEMRDVGRGDKAKASHYLLQLSQRVACCFKALRPAILGDRNHRSESLENQERIDPDK